jgi:hypothetical protein
MEVCFDANEKCRMNWRCKDEEALSLVLFVVSSPA